MMKDGRAKDGLAKDANLNPNLASFAFRPTVFHPTILRHSVLFVLSVQSFALPYSYHNITIAILGSEMQNANDGEKKLKKSCLINYQINCR